MHRRNLDPKLPIDMQGNPQGRAFWSITQPQPYLTLHLGNEDWHPLGLILAVHQAGAAPIEAQIGTTQPSQDSGDG